MSIRNKVVGFWVLQRMKSFTVAGQSLQCGPLARTCCQVRSSSQASASQTKPSMTTPEMFFWIDWSICPLVANWADQKSMGCKVHGWWVSKESSQPTSEQACRDLMVVSMRRIAFHLVWHWARP